MKTQVHTHLTHRSMLRRLLTLTWIQVCSRLEEHSYRASTILRWYSVSWSRKTSSVKIFYSSLQWQMLRISVKSWSYAKFKSNLLYSAVYSHKCVFIYSRSSQTHKYSEIIEVLMYYIFCLAGSNPIAHLERHCYLPISQSAHSTFTGWMYNEWMVFRNRWVLLVNSVTTCPSGISGFYF